MVHRSGIHCAGNSKPDPALSLLRNTVWGTAARAAADSGTHAALSLFSCRVRDVLPSETHRLSRDLSTHPMQYSLPRLPNNRMSDGVRYSYPHPWRHRLQYLTQYLTRYPEGNHDHNGAQY